MKGHTDITVEFPQALAADGDEVVEHRRKLVSDQVAEQLAHAASTAPWWSISASMLRSMCWRVIFEGSTPGIETACNQHRGPSLKVWSGRDWSLFSG